MDAVFAALGDPTRRRILELLRAGEAPVGALVDALRAMHVRISQPAVSQHLKVLRDAHLVSSRAEGTRRFHRIDPAGLDAAQAWLAQLSEPFTQPLDALATEVARGARARKARGASTPSSRRARAS